MLAQMLDKHGLGARAAGLEDVTGPGLARLEASGLKLVCVSYFGAATGLARARYLVRRLKRRFPGARIFACLWSVSEDGSIAEGTLAAGADLVVAVEAAVRTAEEAGAQAAADTAVPAA
jgi:hypothetical protein